MAEIVKFPSESRRERPEVETEDEVLNLDDGGTAAALLAQYTLLYAAAEGLPDGVGIVVVQNGIRRKLDREDIENLCPAVADQFAAHFSGRAAAEKLFYATTAAAGQIAGDWAAARGCRRSRLRRR